jgi:hypothetical protein
LVLGASVAFSAMLASAHFSVRSAKPGEARGFLPPLEPEARGDFTTAGIDVDLDGLLDEVEPYIGADATNADTDGDGYIDGAEWTLGSDPKDPASIPTLQPAVRSCAYKTNDQIRVFCAVYPANLDYVSTFRLLVGSTTFKYAQDGDPGVGLGIVDISGILPLLAGSFTRTTFKGLDLVGFNFDLPYYLLENHGQLNVAWAANLAGSPVVDQLYLGLQGGNAYVLGAGGPTTPGAVSCVIQPMGAVPPTPDETPEYCAVGFSSGSPVGLASVEFSVTNASCEPDGLLYCIAADCSALAGQSFVMVDYGYLQSKTQ